MIDINLIKDNPQAITEKLKLRNYDFDLDLFESLEAKRKKYQIQTEELQAQRNNRYPKNMVCLNKMVKRTQL
jgi:seryl-tRNA synthetase